jgi:hypothetical protein
MSFLKKLEDLIATVDVDDDSNPLENLEVQALFRAHRVSSFHPFVIRVRTILWKLEQLLGMDVRAVVVVDESLFPAAAWLDVVIIGSSFERLADDELAFIIAHELGHIRQLENCVDEGRDPRSSTFFGRFRRQDLEFDADRFARDTVIEAGWEGGGTRVLQRMLASDRRSTARWGLWRAVPFVGWVVIQLRRLFDRWRYSHPSVESRIEHLRAATKSTSRAASSEHSGT